MIIGKGRAKVTFLDPDLMMHLWVYLGSVNKVAKFLLEQKILNPETGYEFTPQGVCVAAKRSPAYQELVDKQPNSPLKNEITAVTAEDIDKSYQYIQTNFQAWKEKMQEEYERYATFRDIKLGYTALARKKIISQ